MEYLDKLRYMVSFKDSQMEDKLKNIQQAEIQRDEKARKVSSDREIRGNLKKEENHLRNVYFSM